MDDVNNRKEAILSIAEKIQKEVVKPIKTEQVNVSIELSAELKYG